jgi:hypothetical protein
MLVKEEVAMRNLDLTLSGGRPSALVAVFNLIMHF